MTCAWRELLAVLPAWLRKEVQQQTSVCIQEIRLRINSPPELVLAERNVWLKQCIRQDDLQYVINAASQYSPWASASVSKGFLTIAGGHRMGLCGEAVVHQGNITGIKNITSVCIRVARDFPGIAAKLAKISGSVLILGAPGWGKTTLLRDLIRQLETEEKICVVDERKELFPEGLPSGNRIDVLSGCSRREGIPMLLRTMGPSCIAVDEITDPEDSLSLLQASHCGIRLLATAHAVSVSDFRTREAYGKLWEQGVFDFIVVLRKDKTYTMERVTEWVTNGSVQY